MSEGSTDAIDVPGPDITSVLLYGVEIGISDAHFSVGDPPMYRLHGSIVPTNLPPLGREQMHMMLYDILDDDQRKTFERDKELDFALQFGSMARFRVNCFYTMHGEAAVFRVIPTKIRTIEDLKVPEVIRRIAEKRRGVALITGPTGSGKTTTLAAMIDYINTTRSEHILTIEDPVEFVHQNKRCVINQREVGKTTKSFAAALRSALREDPDVILVGEMRDLETISLALTAAETGHLVFGTLHTQSASKTCDRIIDVFPPEQQGLVRIMFAESFQAIVCQALIPRKDGKGRVAAMEIMLGVSATRSLIREAKTHQLQTILQTNQKLGMQTLDHHLKELLERNVISERDALLKANNPDAVVAGGLEKLDMLIARTGREAAAAGSMPSGAARGNQFPPPALSAAASQQVRPTAIPAPPQAPPRPVPQPMNVPPAMAAPVGMAAPPRPPVPQRMPTPPMAPSAAVPLNAGAGEDNAPRRPRIPAVEPPPAPGPPPVSKFPAAGGHTPPGAMAPLPLRPPGPPPQAPPAPSFPFAPKKPGED